MHVDVGGRRLFFDIVGEQFEPVGTTMRQRPTLIAIHGAPGVSDHSALRPELSPLADAMQFKNWGQTPLQRNSIMSPY